MRFLSFLVLLILSSGCATDQRTANVTDGAYRTSGVEQFFLAELPDWGNFSAAGKCYKSRSFQYFDFAKLGQSYQLSYREQVELQAQYNARLEEYFRSTAKNFLKPMEESSFFSNTMEQVKGGVRHFKLPRVKEIDLIWLEGFSQAGQEAQLIKRAREGKFEERLPVIFSSCLSRLALQQWISDHNLDGVGFYTLSAEWLSSFDPQSTARPGLYLDLKQLLGPEIKINFTAPAQYPLNHELIF